MSFQARTTIADGAGSSTRQKALALNLEARAYGTFAEIGGGQEVARWFFAVGGAAGTVAKSISAYDMAVSDGIYGPARRYVSRQRLEAMLAMELADLSKRLGREDGDARSYFAFADTVATRGFHKPGEVHTMDSPLPERPWSHLYRLLREIGRVEPLRSFDESYLSIRTPDVLARLQRGDPSWESMVPRPVAEIIKSKRLFRPASEAA